MRYKVRNKNWGFTLVELLITVTIIAVITIGAMVYYGGTLAKSRDSRRMADVEKIRMAAEMAKQIGNTYPTQVNMIGGSYIVSWPADPLSTGAYYYRPTSYTYEICAKMENVGNTNCAGAGCVNCASNCGGSTACNYRLTNP